MARHVQSLAALHEARVGLGLRGLGRVGVALQRALVALGAAVADPGRLVRPPAPVLLVVRALAFVALPAAGSAAPLAFRVADAAQLAGLAVGALVPRRRRAAVAVVAPVALELPRYARRVDVQLPRHVGQGPALHDVVLYGDPHLEGEVNVVFCRRHRVTAFPGGAQNGRGRNLRPSGVLRQTLGPEGPPVCRRLTALPPATDLAQPFLH